MAQYALTTAKRTYYKYSSWVQPKLTSNTSSALLRVSQSSYLNNDSQYLAYKAFDSVANSYWHSSNGFPSWVSWTSTTPLKISNIKVTNRYTDGSYPNSVAIEQSDDDAGWSVVATATGTGGDSVSWNIPISSAVGASKYWRIVINSSTGSNNSYAAIGNLEITARSVADGTSSDYDYYEEEVSQYALTTAKRTYYKHQYTTWTQPILTSNTSYGVVTWSTANSTHYPYFAISGYNTSSTSWWETTKGNYSGWINWDLPETIFITGIQIRNRTGDTRDETIRVYTDSTKTVPIGGSIHTTAEGELKTVSGIPSTGISTNNIYVYVESTSDYCGTSQLIITAKKRTTVAGTPSDYDYYEDKIRQYEVNL